MSVHRGCVQQSTILHLGLGIVAIVTVAIAVLLGQRGASTADDAVGAGEPTPAAIDGTTAPLPSRPPAGLPSAAASVPAGGGTSSPSGGHRNTATRPATGRNTPATNPARGGPSTASTSAASTSAASTSAASRPAMVTAVAPSRPNHAPTPAPPHRGPAAADPGVVVRVPPIVMPSCLVDC